ncbi:MAG: DUF2752 domain-containing protein [Pseudoxanthomonas sp.]
MLAGAGLLAGAGVWVLRNIDPGAAGSPLPKCIFHETTGCWCIGCGLTRALHALVHGDLVTAFAMNPLAMLALPLLPLLLLQSRGWRPPAWLAPLVDFIAAPKLWLWLLPAYWIARNLPWPPFSWLAPGGMLG